MEYHTYDFVIQEPESLHRYRSAEAEVGEAPALEHTPTFFVGLRPMHRLLNRNPIFSLQGFTTSRATCCLYDIPVMIFPETLLKNYRTNLKNGQLRNEDKKLMPSSSATASH